MRAMILAAGFGSRLRPLTDTMPKALVPLGQKTILEHQIKRLEKFGFTEVAVNAHHFADQVKNVLDSIKSSTHLGIHYSFEPEILNTGGGIKKMLEFFPDNHPVLIQNVDILCAMNYQSLFEYHRQAEAEATLVINKNQTDRPLAFSDESDLLGRAQGSPQDILNHFCFCGIQVIQPDLFRTIKDDKFYSIDVYCKAAQTTAKIKGYDITGTYWRDIGTENDLKAAEHDLQFGTFEIEE